MFVSKDKQSKNKNDQLAIENKNFDSCARKCKKSTLKRFTVKLFSHKFNNLSRTFCPVLTGDWFIFNLAHTSWNLQFLQILIGCFAVQIDIKTIEF